MDNTENKQPTTTNEFTKNILAAVGALAVVKAAPVLAAGVAIGTAVSNADKIKKAVNDFTDRMEAEVAKYREEEETLFDQAKPVSEETKAEDESVPKEEPAPKKSKEELLNELLDKIGDLFEL